MPHPTSWRSILILSSHLNPSTPTAIKLVNSTLLQYVLQKKKDAWFKCSQTAQFVLVPNGNDYRKWNVPTPMLWEWLSLANQMDSDDSLRVATVGLGSCRLKQNCILHAVRPRTHSQRYSHYPIIWTNNFTSHSSDDITSTADTTPQLLSAQTHKQTGMCWYNNDELTF
jgi:hypothetical protein